VKININYLSNDFMVSKLRKLLEETRKILKMYGLKPRKKLGQNFTICPKLIDKLIQYASISRDDIVLEIGAGIGTLTIELARRASKIIAVEIDARLVEILKFRLKDYGNVEILHGDIIKMELPKFDKTVSNLPFNLSSPITFKLAEKPIFQCAVLTYQKEFAERMVAKPGTEEYGRLTVTANFFFEVEMLDVISRRCFYPPPEVDAAIVRLKPKRMKNITELDKFFLELVKYLFSQRNRKVERAVATYLFKIKRANPDEYGHLLKKIPYRDLRVRDLSPSDLYCLAENLYGDLIGDREI